MGDRLLRLYHALPPVLRSASATLRGLKLRSWRYGPESETLIAESLERERWSAERLGSWQADRLTRLLHRAATHVPWYREHWSERRRRGDKASHEYLENWPLLGKDAIRAHPEAFVDDDRKPARMFEVNTSGTTGKPLRLWRTREVGRAYYAVLEARFRRWNGVTWRKPWAILGGQAVVPPGATKPPFWVWNGAMHQLYLSANHVSARNAPAYVEAMKRYGVEHLVSYASSATELARQCLAAATGYTGFRVVVTNAEPVFPAQREVIGRAFGAPVRETYGMVEIVAGASECPSGSLHTWPELGHLEVMDDRDDVATATGAPGRLVCTGILNADMPLIRYVIGDRGSIPAATQPCACGRTLPLMGPIEGRTNDMLVAPDGRRVYWLNPVFYGLPIHEAQIIQERLESVRVKYVPGPGFGEGEAGTVSERLKARMGDVDVILEPVTEIPRGPNGKFQAVVCRISDAERRESDARGAA